MARKIHETLSRRLEDAVGIHGIELVAKKFAAKKYAPRSVLDPVGCAKALVERAIVGKDRMHSSSIDLLRQVVEEIEEGDLCANLPSNANPPKPPREPLYSTQEVRETLGIEDPTEPQESPTSTAMSFRINASGLPLMTMDGVVIRVAGTPELPLFCAADVCTAIGHSDSAAAVARHVNPEDAELIRRNVGSGSKQATYVNERGLYALLLGVKLPKSIPFRNWVHGEVLPSIRKTGRYDIEGSDRQGANLEITDSVKALVALVGSQARVAELQARTTSELLRELRDRVRALPVASASWRPSTPSDAKAPAQISSAISTLIGRGSRKTGEAHGTLWRRVYSVMRERYGIEAPPGESSIVQWMIKHGHGPMVLGISRELFA